MMRRRAFLLLAGYAALACKASKSERTGMTAKNESSESLTKLGTELGLEFPPSTRLIGVLRNNGMDDAVRAKLEMATKEFQAFLDQTHIDRATLRPGTRGMLGADRDFWDPHQSKSLRTGQVSRPNARSLNLGFDESRGDLVVAYLMEHGT